MSETVSKLCPFSITFDFGNKVKPQRAKFSMKEGLGMITMLLVTNSDNSSRIREQT
jgi:hypothetical protein